MVFPVCAHGGGPRRSPSPQGLRLSSVFPGLQELPSPEERQHHPTQSSGPTSVGETSKRCSEVSLIQQPRFGRSHICLLCSGFVGCRVDGAARPGPLGWKEFPGRWRDPRGSVESLVSGTEGRGRGLALLLLTCYVSRGKGLPLWAWVFSS